MVQSLVPFQSSRGYLITQSLTQEVSALCPLPSSFHLPALLFLMNKHLGHTKDPAWSLQCAELYVQPSSDSLFLKDAKLFLYSIFETWSLRFQQGLEPWKLFVLFWPFQNLKYS